MRRFGSRFGIGVLVLAFVTLGAQIVLGGGHNCSSDAASASCGEMKSASTATCENTSGKLTGNFDTGMSNMCRYACAAKVSHTAKDVIAQPGAKVGKLTQCPVSGVVFAVDASRPHVRIAKADYVTCCSQCAKKLKANPGRYLKA